MSSAPSGSSDAAPLGDEAPEAGGERDAARLDPDERDALEPVTVGLALSISSCAMRESAFEIASRVEQGRRRGAIWDVRASSGSFPASLDRVKGSRASLAALSDEARQTARA